MATNRLDDSAKIIAQIITNTDSDYRGNLFSKIANELDKHQQCFTARLFHSMAVAYGIKE